MLVHQVDARLGHDFRGLCSQAGIGYGVDQRECNRYVVDRSDEYDGRSGRRNQADEHARDNGQGSLAPREQARNVVSHIVFHETAPAAQDLSICAHGLDPE